MKTPWGAGGRGYRYNSRMPMRSQRLRPEPCRARAPRAPTLQRWLVLVLLLAVSFALAQTLSAPPEGRTGSTLEISGESLPDGTYTLQVTSPAGTESVPVEAAKGAFKLSYTPKAAGTYQFRLALPDRTLEASSTVEAQSQAPRLADGGLQVGNWRLPLPGDWSEPLVVGSKAYLFRGPLVLEVDLSNPRISNRYYPPAEVQAFEAPAPGDAVPTVQLEGGRRLKLDALQGLPYEGRWQSLQVIRDLDQALEVSGSRTLDQSPAETRPYWHYLAQPPQRLTAQDLRAFGRDLLRRGHRPELPWGPAVMLWVGPWLEQMRAARAQGIEASLMWSDTLLAYLPQVPGGRQALFQQAAWLENQGRPDLALRYRAALRTLQSWEAPVRSSSVLALAGVVGGLFVLVALYLMLAYLPAQRRNLASVGGWLAGWFRNPLLRLRHTALAYASFPERGVLLALLLLLAGVVLVYGFARRTEALLADDAFTRGTLRSEAAQNLLRGLTDVPATRGLLAYALAHSDPAESQRLYRVAADWPAALLGRNDPKSLSQAFWAAPQYPAAQDVLGIGGDPWSQAYRDAGVPREGVPTLRSMWMAVTQAGLEDLRRDFLRTWSNVRIVDNPVVGWVSGILLLLLLLHTLLSFFLPRPRGAGDYPNWRYGVQLFFPGSPLYSQGWGVLLAGFGLYCLWLYLEGRAVALYGVAAVVILHLVMWLLARPRRGVV